MANTEQKNGKSKTLKLFTAAVIFALLAGLGTMLYLKVLEHQLKARLTPSEKEMVHVVVAKTDLPVGSKVSSETMAVRPVPKEYVGSDVFTPDQFNSIQGAVLIKPLAHGKMLTQDFIDLNIPKDFSGTIQLGHRAVTIQVDEINSISGLIRPGNSIDLFTRISGSGLSSSQGEELIIPVLEDVLVLATDKHSARPNEDEFRHLASRDNQRTYNTLTLEVTPEEAGYIAIAEARGRLIAALRNSSDTGGVLFNKVSLTDLVAHSGELLQSAISKHHNRSLEGIHVNQKGELVTRDGVVITDPNVHLNKDGLLVTKDGTVLSGRNLIVGTDGKIRTADGKLVDTASLVPGKDTTLVDKNGTVVAGNGYGTAKGGFLVDKDGNVLTPDGNVLSGVTVGKDGKVRTPDGRVITADQIAVGKDGKVRITSGKAAALTVDKNGNIVTADGKNVAARDLVTVGPDGVVRTRDGKVLAGVTVGSDGELHDANGKKLTAADVMMQSAGYKSNEDGTVTDANGKVYTARDLVTVDKNGIVHAKDGTVLKDVHVDKDGNLVDKDGNVLNAADIVKQSAVARAKENAAGDVLAAHGFTAKDNGTVVDRNGKVYKARDLVTVDKDGVVHAKDGTVLTGVHMDKNGNLIDQDGNVLTAADIVRKSDAAKTQQKTADDLMTAEGLRAGADGTVVDKDGRIYQAKDLVTVDKNGVVHAKDGTVLQGAYVDKDGTIRNADGSPMTAQDVFKQEAAIRTASNQGEVLAGVTGHHDEAFSLTGGKGAKTTEEMPAGYIPYEVEYIVGGMSDGAAKTFKVEIENDPGQTVNEQQ